MILAEDAAPILPPEFHCDVQLNKLLTILGIDRQQQNKAGTLQLIGDHHRLNLTGHPLEAEWLRELKTDSPARLLQNLAAEGAKLARSLADNSPSPLFNMRKQLRIAATAWKPGAGSMPLSTPLAKHLQRRANRETLPLLQDLFCGLSGCPANTLSTAQAMLLWYWASQPKTIGSKSFLDVLSRRTAQFHVAQMPLNQLDMLQWSGRNLDGILLKDGSAFKASQFVLTCPSATAFFPPSRQTEQAKTCTCRPIWQTTPIEGNISPLLGDRIVLSGSTPLLAIRNQAGSQTHFLIAGKNDSRKYSAISDDVTRRLQTLLPFTDFRLEPAALPSIGSNAQSRRFFQPCGLPCSRTRRNLLFAIPGLLCPGLGTNGEILLGFALAERLLGSLHR